MKRALYVATLVLAVVLAAGCSMWEETTLTVVNNAGEDIVTIAVDNGSISRGYAPNNILESNLADGELIKIPLAPVLHDLSYASILIETDYDERVARTPTTPTTLSVDKLFTYEEGANVVIRFNGDDDADIEHGEWITLE